MDEMNGGWQVDVREVLPIPDGAGDEIDDDLCGWIVGEVKPIHEGPYVRDFDEGEAVSWWYEERWNMDSFFAGPSDIQDAPWRGMTANPPPAAEIAKGVAK